MSDKAIEMICMTVVFCSLMLMVAVVLSGWPCFHRKEKEDEK